MSEARGRGDVRPLQVPTKRRGFNAGDLLVERAGDLVMKETLLERVLPKLIVSVAVIHARTQHHWLKGQAASRSEHERDTVLQ